MTRYPDYPDLMLDNPSNLVCLAAGVLRYLISRFRPGTHGTLHWYFRVLTTLNPYNLGSHPRHSLPSSGTYSPLDKSPWSHRYSTPSNQDVHFPLSGIFWDSKHRHVCCGPRDLVWSSRMLVRILRPSNIHGMVVAGNILYLKMSKQLTFRPFENIVVPTR